MSIVDSAVRTDHLQLRSTHPRRGSYTPATLFHDAEHATRASVQGSTISNKPEPPSAYNPKSHFASVESHRAGKAVLNAWSGGCVVLYAKIQSVIARGAAVAVKSPGPPAARRAVNFSHSTSSFGLQVCRNRIHYAGYEANRSDRAGRVVPLYAVFDETQMWHFSLEEQVRGRLAYSHSP